MSSMIIIIVNTIMDDVFNNAYWLITNVGSFINVLFHGEINRVA
jgi:hypothetical protein